MRRALLAEARAPPAQLAARLAAIREVLPPSVERDVATAAEFDRQLTLPSPGGVSGASQRERAGWLDAALLEENPPLGDAAESCELETTLLISAITYFPGLS